MKSGFRRAGMTVVVGSVAGYGVSLLLTPVMSRLYAPEVFGSFATVTSVVSVFVGVSTLRLEVLAQRVESEESARLLMRLAGVASVVWGAGVFLVTLACVALLNVSPWWLTAGPLVSVASLQLTGASRLTRLRRYQALGVSNFVQGAGSSLTQIAFGSFAASTGSLLAGFALARLIWLRSIGGRTFGRHEVLRAWRGARRFAAASGSSAAVNSLAGQVPILTCSWMFGQAQVGYLAMAFRILVSPLGVVGQAAAAASIGEVGRLLREGRSAAHTVSRAMRDLFLLGLFPCAAAAALGTWAVPLVLGDAWRQTGVFVAVLSAGTLAQFVAAPFSQLLNLTHHVRWLLLWDVSRLVAVTGSIALPAFTGGSLSVALCAYSVVLVVLYAALGRLSITAVTR